jgi:hypothetical protein
MPIIWASKMERKMRQVAKTSRNFFGETFAVLGAALSVSAAVRAHRKPARADLEALGIDGKAFDRVQL